MKTNSPCLGPIGKRKIGVKYWSAEKCARGTEILGRVILPDGRCFAAAFLVFPHELTSDELPLIFMRGEAFISSQLDSVLEQFK